jgi:hypothetical protein
MAKVTSNELRKGEIVHAREDLHHVPRGTRGKVTFVSGLNWTRYRVQFDNGISIGSLDRRLLARNGETWVAVTDTPPAP